MWPECRTRPHCYAAVRAIPGYRVTSWFSTPSTLAFPKTDHAGTLWPTVELAGRPPSILLVGSPSSSCPPFCGRVVPRVLLRVHLSLVRRRRGPMSFASGPRSRPVAHALWCPRTRSPAMHRRAGPAQCWSAHRVSLGRATRAHGSRRVADGAALMNCCLGKTPRAQPGREMSVFGQRREKAYTTEAP